MTPTERRRSIEAGLEGWRARSCVGRRAKLLAFRPADATTALCICARRTRRQRRRRGVRGGPTAAAAAATAAAATTTTTTTAAAGRPRSAAFTRCAGAAAAAGDALGVLGLRRHAADERRRDQRARLPGVRCGQQLRQFRRARAAVQAELPRLRAGRAAASVAGAVAASAVATAVAAAALTAALATAAIAAVLLDPRRSLRCGDGC